MLALPQMTAAPARLALALNRWSDRYLPSALGIAVLLTFATFLLATLFGCISGVGGYLFAFFYDYPVGGSQTVAASLLVAVTALIRGFLDLLDPTR